MKRIFLIFAVLVSAVISVSAQSKTTLPDGCTDVCKAFCPDYLIKTTVLRESDLNKEFSAGSKYAQDEPTEKRRYWDVYSDRHNNTTYKDSYGKTPYGSLGFNERVRIAVIKGDYALVYTEKSGATYPQISQNIEWRGWVPMKNLLLWHTCPADNHGIYQKALICVNLDEASGNAETLSKKFYSPTDLKNYENLSSEMDFYFVMKREGNMYLLASSHSMDGISDGVLFGWVHKQSFVAWNQRSCLEPNWNKTDYDFFVAKEQKIYFYDNNKKEGSAPMYWEFEPKQWNGVEDYRWPGSWLRYPLLDNSTETLYNVSTFAASGDGDMSQIYQQQAEQRQREEKVSRDLSHINIGIVIDGTRSMGKYYKPIADAVKDCIENFFKDGHKTVQVGAVIYRDHGDGEGLVEEYHLTRYDNNNLWTWFLKGGEYGIKSENDSDNEEALYYGINHALDVLKFNPDQSNILLVIGDCGNRENDRYSDINQDMLVKRLIGKRVSIVSFQLQRTYADSYSTFINQMNDIQRKTIQGLYNEFSDLVKVVMRPGTDGHYQSRNNVNNTLYSSLLCFPQSCPGEMTPADVTQNIEKIFYRYSESVKKQIMTAQGGVHSIGSSSNLTAAGGTTVDKEFYENRIGGKVEGTLSFRGYTDKEIAGRAVFEPVIFISSEELTELIDRLNRVNPAALTKNPKDRKAFIEALKSLINAEAEGSSDFGGKSVEDVQAIFFGLNTNHTAVGRSREMPYNLKDLENPDIVDDQAYRSVVSKFADGFRKLRNIKAGYDYKFSNNGLTYFWIPVKDLPL